VTTIITRSAIKYWSGQEPPPELAYRVSTGRGHQQLRDVTWAEVMQQRRERQAIQLRWRREGLGHRKMRAVRITARYFDQFFYGGWHVYVDSISFSHWIRNGEYGLSRNLMELLPLANTWEEWKPAFANAYPCGEFGGRPRGMVYGWAETNGTLPCRIQSLVVSSTFLVTGESSMSKKKDVEENQTQQEKPMEIVYIPVGEISPNPFQPRRDRSAEADEELAESIREHGVLQPVLVRASIPGYELIGGSRRVDAARAAGLAKVPAVVKYGITDSEAAELAIIDNVQRQQISLLDEAFAYKRLRDEFQRTADDIAARCHRSKTSIYDALRVADLPENITAAVRDGALHYSHAVALTGAASDESKLQEIAEQTVRFGYTAKQVEGMIQSWKGELEKEAAEREAREKPPLPLETESAESTPAEESSSTSEATTTDETAADDKEAAEPDKSATTETITTKTTTSTSKEPSPSSSKNPTPATPAASPAPAAPKAPEGMVSTFVPKDDCLFCQDAGLTMQDVFALVRRIIEMGKPKGLSPDDVLATTEALLSE